MSNGLCYPWSFLCASETDAHATCMNCTRHMYKLYMPSVRTVHAPCTDCTCYLYGLYMPHVQFPYGMYVKVISAMKLFNISFVI